MAKNSASHVDIKRKVNSFHWNMGFYIEILFNSITNTVSFRTQYKTQRVERGDLTVTVSATGNLEPTNRVDVGSQLSGIIRSVLVQENDRVKVNQTLARLDTSKLEAQHAKNKAELASANAKGLQARATRVLGTTSEYLTVRDMREIVSMLTSTTRVLTALLSAVAAVSLLVGGIGIMNIMLVSVTERTRESGTRLAIGGRERDVLMQVLVEAVVLSSFGGVCGIVTGLSAAAAGADFLGIPFVFQAGIVMTAFAFSAAVGVIFGYFPARKAARLDPIEALRYE